MGAEHTKRRKAFLAELAGRKLDCLLVTHPALKQAETKWESVK